jgi:hypothetical protein
MGGLREVRPNTYSIPDAELATTPASVLATQLGCAPSTIHRRRHRAGVEFKGEHIPPPGRPVTFDWSALDPSKSITENMTLTGCDNREYVGLKRRQLRSANAIGEARADNATPPQNQTI